MGDLPLCVQYLKKKKLPPPTLGQFQEALMALSEVHSRVWKLLREIHVGQNKGTIPSRDIGPGDWVWVKRHQTKTLEPK